MAKGFWSGLGHHLESRIALVFTVGGVAITLLLVEQAYWPVALLVLVVAALLLGSGSYAYSLHSQNQQAETRHQDEMRETTDRHQAELAQTQAEHRTATQRLQEAEQKLNEVPLGIVTQLKRVLEEYSTADFGRSLIRYAEFVVRMQAFARASPRSLNLRRFVRQAGGLYLAAKGAPAALANLRAGDPFVLLRVGTDRLETPSARVVVHQKPEQDKDVVLFRIVAPLAEEIGYIERLAETGEVEGLKGYRLTPACATDDYPEMDASRFSAFLHRLVADLTQTWGG